MAPALQTTLGKELGERIAECIKHGEIDEIQKWANDYADRLTIEAHSEQAYKSHTIGMHFADAKIFLDLATALQPFVEKI